MKINKHQKLVTLLFVAITVLWLFLFVTQRKSGDLNYLYSFAFGLIPLYAGIVGMVKSRMWGGLKSALGRAIFFVSLGLAFWGTGEAIWSYYNFFKNVPAPYPSLADLGFAPSIFFWIIGTLFLTKATGALFALQKSHWAKVLAIGIPVLLLIPSYYIQIKLARGGVLVPPNESALKTVLDIAYPFGDFLALTLATVVFTLSYKFMGGIYRKAIILLLLGLAVMYAADSIFSYTTTKGTYYNANAGDLLLATGQYLMSVAILAFATKPKIKSAN